MRESAQPDVPVASSRQRTVCREFAATNSAGCQVDKPYVGFAFRCSPDPLYSVVTLYVHQNAERLALSPRRAAWYPKPAPTFADVLARLRRHLWFEQIVMSANVADRTEPIAPELQGILDAVCYAP